MQKITERAKIGDSVLVEGTLTTGRQESPSKLLGIYGVRFDGHKQSVPVYEHFVYEFNGTHLYNIQRNDSKTLSDFGKNLRYMRLKRGMSQIALDAAIGAYRGSVGAWERGAWAPRLHAFRPLVEALDIDYNTLLRERKSA